MRAHTALAGAVRARVCHGPSSQASATLSSSAGLLGRVAGPPSLPPGPRYMRAEGFLRSRNTDTATSVPYALVNYTLRVRDGPSQVRSGAARRASLATGLPSLGAHLQMSGLDPVPRFAGGAGQLWRRDGPQWAGVPRARRDGDERADRAACRPGGVKRLSAELQDARRFSCLPDISRLCLLCRCPPPLL
jgi:hypothetical protein